MKIQIVKSKRGWYWRAVAGNRKILCHSEVYQRRRDAEKGARLVLFSGEIADEFEVVE